MPLYHRHPRIKGETELINSLLRLVMKKKLTEGQKELIVLKAFRREEEDLCIRKDHQVKLDSR